VSLPRSICQASAAMQARGDSAIVSNFGPQEQAMQAYFREGEARAMTLGNRGPILFTDEGSLHPDIIAGL